MTEIDFAVLYFIREHLSNPLFNWLMPFLSVIGNSGAVWIVFCIALIFFKKTRKIGIAGLIAMLFGYVAGELILKNIFCRVRPFNIDLSMEILVPRPGGYSFPSGHTASSFSCATVFFVYNKKLGIPALILASLIGFSRLYNFVHFPSDVLGGMLLGIACAVVSVLIVKRTEEIWRKKLGKA